jgi:hypothetical protein
VVLRSLSPNSIPRADTLLDLPRIAVIGGQSSELKLSVIIPCLIPEMTAGKSSLVEAVSRVSYVVAMLRVVVCYLKD